MSWFSRLLIWLGLRRPPPEVDFGGAIGKLPLRETPPFIRLHITAADQILVEDQPVPLADLEQVLRTAHRPGLVVAYSRERYDTDSQMVDAVFECIGRLGLQVALPAELTEELNRYYAEHPPTS